MCNNIKCALLSYLSIVSYAFNKMNSRKCKLNFMILQTKLVIGSTNFSGLLN